MATEVTARRALEELTFGQRIAEHESQELAEYFVETLQWRRLISGDVDLVYGPKGAGKSALYAKLLAWGEDQFYRGRYVIPAEDPAGDPAFSHLSAATDLTEEQLKIVWKVYFLVLLCERFERANEEYAAKTLRRNLEQAGLLRHSSSLAGKVMAVVDFVRMRDLHSIEAGLGLGSGASLRLERSAQASEPWNRLSVSMNSLFQSAQDALKASGRTAWLALDRLDTAFSGSAEMESRALRALFRVYRDMDKFDRISLKVFLRTDVWQRITSTRFSEASHLTRKTNIEWQPETLLDLIMRRALSRRAVRTFVGIERDEAIRTYPGQLRLFHTLFSGERNPRGQTVWEWALTHTRDGSDKTEPRELIHLLSEARDLQLRESLRTGAASSRSLIAWPHVTGALPAVSEERLHQTLYGEYPDVKPWVQRLRGQSVEQSIESLAEMWCVEKLEAQRRVERLVEVGFLEKRAWERQSLCRVPVLYRSALDMLRRDRADGLRQVRAGRT